MAAETAILYNGKRIIPAPQLAFNKEYNRSGDKSGVGSSHSVTLSGTLVGGKGFDFTGASPDFYTGSSYPTDDSGGDYFTNLVQMQDKMRELFAYGNDYKWFEVIGCDGLIKKWMARVTSVDFAEGRWTHVCEYTITLELQDATEITDDSLQLDHSENWEVQFEEEDGGIYKLTHTLSAQAEEFATTELNVSEGWKVAKAWVDARLAGANYTGAAPTSINNTIIFGSTGFNLTDYTAYDYTVQRSVDEFDGMYSVSETWTLAKYPVFRTWSVSYSKDRAGDGTVSVEGEFRSFLNRTTPSSTPSNGGAALTAFETWETANSAYAIANAFYVSRGTGTLDDCPTSRSVSIVQESRGDGTTTYGAEARSVKFSYEFSDAPSDADVSLTKTINYSLVDSCETNVTISGSIQGYDCGEVDKLTSAQTAYAAINCTTEANSLYDGSGTLMLIGRSYTENERQGTIEFTCEFTDKFDAGEFKDEKTTVRWTCGELGTDGDSKTSYSVDGSIKAVCGGETPTAPLPSSYSFGEDVVLKQTSVTTDDINKTVSYQYEWDNDDGAGLVEISVDIANGPTNCDVTESTVEFSVQGNGCNSTTMLANALEAIAALNPDTYAYAGSTRTSYKRNINRTRGTVKDAYTYTTEGYTSLSVTITESQDSSNCGEPSYTIDGTIEGRCYAVGGAMAAAETLFLSHQASDYTEYGCLFSSKISRTEKEGKISFNYEFRSCDSGYEHEQTVSTKTDDSDCCTEVSLSGTITPYCVTATGRAGLVATAEAAWTTILATLATTAAGYCTETLVLRSTTLSRNKYNGQIQYTYTYQCCNSTIDGVLKESINITYEHPTNVIAIVPILGRACGPLVQRKNTKTAEKCSISIDLLLPKQCGASYAMPSGLSTSVDSLLSSLNCCSGAYATHKEKDIESWNPRTGQYNRSVVYMCECCE